MKSLKTKIVGYLKFSMSAKLYLSLVNFAVNILLARLFAPNELGEFFLIFSLLVTANVMGQLGLRVVAAKLLPKALADKSKQVPILTGLILIGGLIGAVTASLLIFLTSSWLDVFLKPMYLMDWFFISVPGHFCQQ